MVADLVLIFAMVLMTSQSQRLFFALKAPRAWQEAALALQATLMADTPNAQRHALRWAHVDDLHVTVCFLGHLSALESADLMAQFSLAQSLELHLALGGADYFLTQRNQYILWLDMTDPQQQLARLVAQVNQQVRGILPKFKPLQHYIPHMTIARGPESSASTLAAPIKDLKPYLTGAQHFDQLLLMSTDLAAKPQTSRYRMIQAYP